MLSPYNREKSFNFCGNANDNSRGDGAGACTSPTGISKFDSGIANVESLLSEKMGLESESIGKKRIANIVNKLMKCSAIDNLNEYIQILESDSMELDKLINEITVPETWFFRNNESFNYLAKHVCDFRSCDIKKKMLKILSVPCSSGEEPYSIAITLLEAGLLAENFQIDAIDISQKAIESAKHAVYGKSAFRFERNDYKNKYFTASGEDYILDSAITKLVVFYRDNFLKADILDDRKPYDIIFCKNLIIYLTNDARKRVFDNIQRLLLPGGVVFTGYAEIVSFLQNGYAPVEHARSFACRNTGLKTENNFIVDKPIKKVRKFSNNTNKIEMPAISGLSFSSSRDEENDFLKARPDELSRTFAGNSLEGSGKTKKTLKTDIKSESVTIMAIRTLADRGLLDEALSKCEQFLKKDTHNKDAYYLMGLINLALNVFDRAENYFQKTLYLDPDHHEALLHMKLLYEKKGDTVKASLVEGRIKRYENRTGKSQ